MKIKAITKLPRLITIPELDVKEYRELQAGKAVEVAEDSGEYLLKRGFAEKLESAVTAGGTNGE